MNNNYINYAKELVGDLDRSYYDKQRQSSQNIYNTNWENIKNQYNNLTEELKNRQKLADRTYAEGLVNVSDNSFDRMRSANADLVNRGVANSGLSDMVRQADIRQKGNDVNDLLENSNAVLSSGAEQLANANTQMANKLNNEAANLANDLGNIGSSETGSQMSYNNALANLAEKAAERDFNNNYQAQQRALQNSSNSGDDLDKQLEEAYNRIALADVLTSKDLTDTEKMNALAILFERGNAKDIVDAYNYNTKGTDNSNETISKLNNIQKANVNALVDDPRYNTVMIYDYMNKKGLDPASLGLSYNSSKQDFKNAVNGEIQNLVKQLNDETNYTGITYKDLASIIYK